MFRIGAVSDTHNFFDPKITDLLAGVDHILHGGDVGLPRIILALEQIAPVTYVTGNTDDPGLNYPLTEVITLANKKFLLHHIVNPAALTPELNGRIAREKPDVVVFGHTHKPASLNANGVMFFNPGYAGKSRFGMPRTIALLSIDENRISTEFLKLD